MLTTGNVMKNDHLFFTRTAFINSLLNAILNKLDIRYSEIYRPPHYAGQL